MSFLKNIDATWTLFLDRDGVINHEKYKDYIHTWEEFKFYEGAKEAISIFSGIFKRIVIVTNQKGVGKGVTKLDDLQRIHSNMMEEIENAGGRIDAVFFCSDLDEDSPNRKPNPGMGYQALEKFPEIDLNKSIMVGNTIGDMQFGRNLGIQTVFILTTHPEMNRAEKSIDLFSESLIDFAHLLIK